MREEEGGGGEGEERGEKIVSETVGWESCLCGNSACTRRSSQRGKEHTRCLPLFDLFAAGQSIMPGESTRMTFLTAMSRLTCEKSSGLGSERKHSAQHCTLHVV